MKLDEEAVEEALYDVEIRRRIARDYQLDLTALTSPIEFVNGVIEGFDQHRGDDPLQPRENTEVFEAAVKALASNSRAWTVYVNNKPVLRELLGGMKPEIARGVDTTALAEQLPGPTSTSDTKAIVRWAELLADLNERGRRYYDGLIELAETIKGNAGDQGIALPEGYLMLCVVGHLADGPSRQWKGPSPGKLAGMGFALGSEFLRNLGWNGFKPDRHIVRLLDSWVPDLVNRQAEVAEQLVSLTGRNTAELRTMTQYSLAGIAISPSDNYSRADNLLWLLGHYVETKRKGGRAGKTRYLLP